MKRLFFLTLCLGWLGAACAFAGERDILVIQSYHEDMVWTGQCESGIRDALGPGYALHVFYMDTKRLPESRFAERADAAWAEYERLAPALVMLGDDNALRLLGPRFAAMGTPVVYFGINNNPRSYFDVLPRNVTGVLERLPLFPWLRYLKQLMPDAWRALVLFDTSPTTDAILAVTFKDQRLVEITGLTAKYAVAADWRQWRETVTKRHDYDLIVIPTFHALRDADGRHVPVHETIQWTSANSRVPVFALQDYAVEPGGAVGAYVVFGVTQGRLAGELALDILERGAVPKDLQPLMGQEGRFYFNKEQLKRFGLVLPEAIRRKTAYR